VNVHVDQKALKTMRLISLLSGVLASGLVVSPRESLAEPPQQWAEHEENLRTFLARGVVKELEKDGSTVVVSHEPIASYMDAMTMPFKVKEPKELAGLRAGDQISFRLVVTDKESWIAQITKVGTIREVERKQSVGAKPPKHWPLWQDIHFSITSSATSWGKL
jgi:Cu/Ag efflux protein CusF